jgi:uncharacterized OsmC-like protein
MSEVIVEGSASGFAQQITVGRHHLPSDEPVNAGGADSGPSPYDLLLSALGSCTSMTLGVYARRKQWPLESVVVRLRHSRVYATDCSECETNEGLLDRIELEIQLVGKLSEEQRTKLLEISHKCPVYRTLVSEINIRTRLI